MSALLLSTLFAALLAGLAGSTHCLAMCGGIAGALGISSRAAAERSGRPLVFPFAYNAGRVLSYSLAGALVGGLGAGLGHLAGMDRVRLGLQFLAGAVLILLGLRLVAGRRGFAWMDAAGARLWRKLSPLLRHVLPIDNLPRALGAGMLWGWLPCGMAYGVLSVAWLSADPVHGAAIMAVFGLGTLPALAAASGLAARIGAAAGSTVWRAAAGFVIAGLGALSIAGPWLLGDAAHAAKWLDALVAACLPARAG